MHGSQGESSVGVGGDKAFEIGESSHPFLVEVTMEGDGVAVAREGHGGNDGQGGMVIPAYGHSEGHSGNHLGCVEALLSNARFDRVPTEFATEGDLGQAMFGEESPFFSHHEGGAVGEGDEA